MFWLLVFSYWVHLLATVIWLGGLATMGLAALPAMQRQTLQANQWLQLQMRLIPWANGSLILLLVTGFVQMTNDPNYSGFLNIDGLWAGAMLIKHIAFAGMVGLGAYLQGRLYPAMQRAALLATQQAKAAEGERRKLQRQEIRLLRFNLICALVILFCTAIATAV